MRQHKLECKSNGCLRLLATVHTDDQGFVTRLVVAKGTKDRRSKERRQPKAVHRFDLRVTPRNAFWANSFLGGGYPNMANHSGHTIK
jgi:hypothetical protein